MNKPTPEGLAFLDIETSGLSPFRHEIMEVGIVLSDFDGAETDELAFSMPFNPHLASQEALQVNGYGVREFAPIVEKSEGAMLMTTALKDRIVVANNVVFDLTFIRVFLNQTGYLETWHYSPIELKSLVAGALNLTPPWSTSYLAERVGVSLPKNNHAALVDARWNYHVYCALNLKSDYQP